MISHFVQIDTVISLKCQNHFHTYANTLVYRAVVPGCAGCAITVKNNLHNFVGFVLSTINFVAGTNEYGPKKG